MLDQLRDPPREFSLLPFWFWNDALEEDEILRQMEDFAAHGVYGFVIHPRVGLPRDIGFMSERFLHFVRFAVQEAARRELKVVLYDEGMYPSGSASGLVVQGNVAFRCRGLICLELEGDHAPVLPAGHVLVAVVKRANGRTVIGIFTDEAKPLGKLRTPGMVPGTAGFLQHVQRLLGYDFTPHLPCLWHPDEPEAEDRRRDYLLAVRQRLQETYYQPLHDWCAAHNLDLMGHPSGAGDLGMERYFHVPGRDLVWRKVLAGAPSGLEGEESTLAKCTSSAMVHLGWRRNSSECFGAYGHQFTWEEMKGLTDWCFVRGVNMLIPHAFYYSVRGPRKDERPPDVGPHSPWWNRYREYADYCRRLSWLNTDSQQVCHIALLQSHDELPWKTAKILLQHQRDFNYLDGRHLWEDAEIRHDGLHLRGMHYKVLIAEASQRLSPQAQAALAQVRRQGQWVLFADEENKNRSSYLPCATSESELLDRIAARVPEDVRVRPAQQNLRCRHVFKCDTDWYLLSNEGEDAIRFTISVAAEGSRQWIDPFLCTARPLAEAEELLLSSFSSGLLCIRKAAVG